MKPAPDPAAATDAPPTPTPTTAPPPDPRAARPLEVTTRQFTITDKTRVTPATAETEALPTRTLEVWLTLPVVDEPVPLIIFSHGMSGHPRKFEDLHRVWAEAGYAVAAPAFPLTNDTVPGAFANVADVLNQPGDVVFVLDHLLARNADPTDELGGRFDPARLAAGGLSAGGATTYEAAVNDRGRDRRFRAAIVMAGLRFTDANNGGFVAPTDLPVFLLHGDADPLIPASTAATIYDGLTAPRYLLTLLGGGHAGPFEDADDRPEPVVPGTEDLVYRTTIAFLDLHLVGYPDAADELLAAAAVPELATFVADAG